MPGGRTTNYDTVSTLSVYDIASDTWIDSIFLSEHRVSISSVINGDKLYCGGGFLVEATTVGLLFSPSSVVDIIDVNTLEVLETATLSIPRMHMSAVAVGTKVLFAGGFELLIEPGSPAILNSYSRVDIYDTLTNTWSTAELSEARGGMAHAVLGDKVYFAGGVRGPNLMSNNVDIYDAATDTWSTSSLSFSRGFFGGGVAATNNKIYFAGGISSSNLPTDVIDVYDVEEDTWSVETLSEPRAYIKAVATENNILFSGGGNAFDIGFISQPVSQIIDIYNIPSNSWSAFEMDSERKYHAAFAVGNKAFIVGGEDVEMPLNTMLIYEEMTSPNRDILPFNSTFQIYPNPVEDLLSIENETVESFQFSIIDILGKELLNGYSDSPSTQINLSQLPAGTYILTTSSVDGALHSSQIITKMRE